MKSVNRLARLDWTLPVAIAILIPLTTTLCYLSTYRWHFHALPVYLVSDAAAIYPEAGYFAFFWLVCMILWTITNIRRRRQLTIEIFSTTSEETGSRRLERANAIGFYAGLASSLGTLMLCSFRSSEQVTLHAIGACFIVLGLMIHCYCQTYIAWKLSRHGRNRRHLDESSKQIFTIDQNVVEAHSRPITLIFFSVIVTLIELIFGLLFLCVMSNFRFVDYYEYHFRMAIDEHTHHWRVHVWFAAFEWILMNWFSIYFACLANRMRKFWKRNRKFDRNGIHK